MEPLFFNLDNLGRALKYLAGSVRPHTSEAKAVKDSRRVQTVEVSISLSNLKGDQYKPNNRSQYKPMDDKNRQSNQYIYIYETKKDYMWLICLHSEVRNGWGTQLFWCNLTCCWLDKVKTASSNVDKIGVGFQLCHFRLENRYSGLFQKAGAAQMPKLFLFTNITKFIISYSAWVHIVSCVHLCIVSSWRRLTTAWRVCPWCGRIGRHDESVWAMPWELTTHVFLKDGELKECEVRGPWFSICQILLLEASNFHHQGLVWTFWTGRTHGTTLCHQHCLASSGLKFSANWSSLWYPLSGAWSTAKVPLPLRWGGPIGALKTGGFLPWCLVVWPTGRQSVDTWKVHSVLFFHVYSGHVGSISIHFHVCWPQGKEWCCPNHFCWDLLRLKFFRGGQAK